MPLLVLRHLSDPSDIWSSSSCRFDHLSDYRCIRREPRSLLIRKHHGIGDSILKTCLPKSVVKCQDRDLLGGVVMERTMNE